MNFSIYSPRHRPARFRQAIPSLGMIISLWFGFSEPVRANVYPTNVRLNGGTTNVTASTGTSLIISYLLNEPASSGVTVAIKSNATTLRTISLAGGGAGAARGTNSVIWNGKDDSSNNLAPGSYSIHVTASASGYGDWTQISDDGGDGNYAYAPTSIAVNRNSNSPYYGRVFVANALQNPSGLFLPGDAVGVLKANADGSAAEEGIFSSGGWPWAGDFFSPWKIEISAADFAYVNDWTTNGIILRFDQTISPGSRTLVLRDDNWPDSGQAKLAGPAIVGTGTNTQVWMADIRTNGVGVRRFHVSAAGTLATNDLGTTIVPTGGDSQLTDYPYDVAVDRSNRIYTIQYETDSGNTNYRVFRFPAYDESGSPLTNSDWRIGSGDDDLRGASGIAVDATATNVAVAFRGVGSGISRTGGGVRVFSTADGSDVWALPPAPFHDYTDVAWDNAGNLYVCDTWDSVWRAYSPPGENQTTTVALAAVQVLPPPTPPILSGPAYAAGQFQFTLSGQANVTYIIQSSTNLQSWTSAVTNASAAATRPISLAAPAVRSFYRALVAP
jgi:hypothetical protein